MVSSPRDYEPIQPEQRYTRANPCPICGGGNDDEPKMGVRCTGYVGTDGIHTYCTREQYAGEIEANDNSAEPTYEHRLRGPCECGETHDVPPGMGETFQQSENGSSPRVLVKTTRYRLEFPDGKLAGIHIRKDYEHFDEQGEIVHTKDILWWDHNNRPSADMPLYRVRDLLAAPKGARVYVTEGEKACDALTEHKVLAVATVTGANGMPCDTTLKALLGYDVVLWPDNDPDGKGQRHMERISAKLYALGAATVSQVTWPSAPEKGDAADYVPQDPNLAKLPLLIGTVPPPGNKKKFHWRDHDLTASQLQKEKIVPRVYIVEGIIPYGFSQIAGRPKSGKSTLSLQTGIAATSNGTVLGAEVKQGTVLYLALEDTKERTQARLNDMIGRDAYGNPLPWPENFHIFYEWPTVEEGGLAEISDFIEAYPDTVCVIIDSLKIFRGRVRGKGGYDTDYEFSHTMSDWVNKNHVSVLAVLHTIKRRGADSAEDDPTDLVQNTTGMTAGADTILVMQRHDGVMKLYRCGRDLNGTDPITLRGDSNTLLWSLGDDTHENEGGCRAAILRALADDPEPMNYAALANITAIQSGTIRGTVRRMLMEEMPLIGTDRRNIFLLTRPVQPNVSDQ